MRSVWGTRLFHCYGCSPEGILLIWPMQHPPRVLRLSWDQTHLPTHGLTVYKDMTRGSSKRPDFSWSVTCCQAWDLRVTLGRHCTTRWRVQPVGFVQSHIALGDRGGKEPKTRHHMETRCFCRETDPWLDVAVVNLQLEPFFLAKWKFSRHPMCKGSNFRDHWMQSPCWRKSGPPAARICWWTNAVRTFFLVCHNVLLMSPDVSPELGMSKRFQKYGSRFGNQQVQVSQLEAASPGPSDWKSLD